MRISAIVNQLQRNKNLTILTYYNPMSRILFFNILIFYYCKLMDNQKGQALKIRKDKKKNTETGLLMGQNTNVFSQLSATYLQSKSSTTQQQSNFVNSTQIIQYHDPNINRLIGMLRKKADVTKAKAAAQLRQQISKMSQEDIEQFIQTFSHLFREIVINQQSKQVIDQFIQIMVNLLDKHKKLVIKQISTLFGPILVINKANNTNQLKVYSMLFTGTDEQLQDKALTLLLSKSVSKKFIIFCRVIIECEEPQKIGQQNYQRNCTSLLRIIKDFMRYFDSNKERKEEVVLNFKQLIEQVNEIVSGKFAQEYLKVGGKAKGAFLEFYQALILLACKHSDWGIQWQNYAKIICQNFLDKDITIQQALWRSCNRQFIQTTLEIESKQEVQQGKQKERYRILHKYLPKPDEKLLSALRLGGQSLYKQLPMYCSVFPYTIFEQTENNKSAINKISYIRKLMQTILQLEDENEIRAECYFNLACYFIKILRKCGNSIQKLQEKKIQQIKSLASKAEKEIVNSLQQRFYKSPPTSRNSFSYFIPQYFCRILSELEPLFDFAFDEKQTFQLYTGLRNTNTSQYLDNIYDRIFNQCGDNQVLLLKYLESFPSRLVNIDMSQKNLHQQQASKIFVLSQNSLDFNSWFREEWDIYKLLITYDPRITRNDLKAIEDSPSKFCFRPSSKGLANQSLLLDCKYDQVRFKYFIGCLSSQQQQISAMLPIMMAYQKDVILQRKDSQIQYLNKILEFSSKIVEKIRQKKWIVSEIQVTRIRVVSQLVLEGLKVLKQGVDEKEGVNKQLAKQFLQVYCLFVLTMHSYKLETESQQLLKLASRSLQNEFIQTNIYLSVREAIKIAYANFSSSGNNKQSEQKQRKNRLSRILEFIKKLIWFCLNKRKQNHYLELVGDVTSNGEWKYSELRPDLWLMLEVLIETLDQKTKKSVARKIISQYEKCPQFLNLLFCSQLILPLQRHPNTKKIVNDLQSIVSKQLSQSPREFKSKVVNSMITESLKNQSFLVVYGVKNFVKYLLKNYQSLDPIELKQYADICINRSISSLKLCSNVAEFNRNCILSITLTSQFPLLDLPEIQALHDSLLVESFNEQDPVKYLGLLAIMTTMWNFSIGIEKIATQIPNIILKFQRSATEALQISPNFSRFYALNFVNSIIQVKSQQLLKQQWNFIINQIALPQVKQGALLHGDLQSSRYKFISKIFSTSNKQLQIKLSETIPDEILRQVNFYKGILDQIENQECEILNEESSVQRYENIIQMFIEFAQVLVRITSKLTRQIQPKEEKVLQLLQCPFPGIKKTSFMLLKQMYQLAIVDRIPPSIFLSYLKIDADFSKRQLDPNVGNMLSGYLYSWQAIIQRRTAIQRPAQSQQEVNVSLQDFLQTQRLHEPFLKIIFQILQNQLEYTKNEQQFLVDVEQVVQMDSIITIEDDSNIINKMFRLTIRTLFMFVENFPLFLRDFVDKNKKYRVLSQRLLRNTISDAIFKQEITKIQVREHEWKSAGNFQIYVVPKNKQIYAQYTHDVIRIGLRLSMKGNYPLTPISIQFGEGLKIQQGSRWALMLQTQLHSRNNTIINGILLWKDNIDKKLAGVQECSICFDIVNGNGQLPKKGCKTCKKKFHSVCIMKWFSKSNKSECPLCKSQFL